MAASRFLGTALVLLLLLAPLSEAGDFGAVEDEFERAIKLVSPCTVICVARNAKPENVMPTTGVVVSRSGLVLSDGDVGAVRVSSGRTARRTWETEVEVRLPDLNGRGFETFDGVVLKRDRDLDTSLIKLVKPPSGLKYLKAGNSDDLRVGSFTFTMGNAFGMAGEVPPSLTAGLVCSLPPAEKPGEGRYQRVFTTAAVNPGVNGGPLVDVEGRLVGTISSAVRPHENKGNQPYQFLGRAVPIERLKAFYAGMPEARGLFTDASSSQRSRDAARLELVFHRTGRLAHASTVSLAIQRKTPLVLAGVDTRTRRPTVIARYTGPVSGFAVSQDGFILTSIYHLGNVFGVVNPFLPGNAPAAMKFESALAGVESATAHFQNGENAPARLVAYHEGLGVALFKAERKKDAPAIQLLEPVPTDWYAAGRLVMTIANPFGDKRLPDPLLAFGILSKRHAEDATEHWRGQWQTDASGTDGTAGAPIVDLRGRLVGMQTLWDPWRQGRNSGISFVVPWYAIERVLPEMKQGRNFTRPWVGVQWEPVRAEGGMRIVEIIEKGPADAAGLLKGDIITRIDDMAVTDRVSAVRAITRRWSGDTIRVTFVRQGAEKQAELKLGTRK